MKWKSFSLLLLLGSLFSSSHASAQGDETGLFSSVSPDALIVLDLSGSMLWAPPGEIMYTTGTDCNSSKNPFYSDSGPGHTQACSIDAYGTVPKYGDASCSGPFYRKAEKDYETDCSRLAIAKRAIFNILDGTQNQTIDGADEQQLNIRFGYMRFYDCSSDDAGGSYSGGCNKLIRGIGSKYSQIYCNSSSSCSPASGSSGSVGGESASGGTPLASSLNEAKLYLDAHRAEDSARACRKKFVILITDGADTFSCGGNGSEDQGDQYKRRRRTVAKARELAEAGYRVFVVGFGASMPHYSRNTLNWAALYGQTDNPFVENAGGPGAYNPSAVAECQASTTSSHNIEGDGNHSYANLNDPGEIPLSGYAFLATNATELNTYLQWAIGMIREDSYSFSTASVSSQRSQDENYLYEASFQPINGDPFWRGHLIKYNLLSDGSVGSSVWNAGSVLEATSASARNLLTYKSGALTSFSTANITKEDLGVSTNAQRDSIVGYMRGEAAHNPDGWKLGDIFHSNPITIGTPSRFFEDLRDANNAFAAFRQNNQRTTANGLRMVVVGSNDGQVHAFKALDGRETWSFVPPNFLPKLKNVAHPVHPTGLSHQFFVDGPVSSAEVWLGTGTGLNKAAADWRTLLIFGEGRGGGTTLWSSSSSCDSGFNPTYAPAYPNYCGYWAFDATNTANPAFRWRLNPAASQAPYLGDPWNRIVVGRVKIGGNEKWVGFLGGGYNASSCAGGGGCDSRGKGFFVVDLINGNILWSFTRADAISNGLTMDYSLAAFPAIADTDNDGFIDTAYIGDLGGSMWRFKFCSASDSSACGASSWSGGRLFEASAGVVRPIFSTATVAKDGMGNLWVDWGTGDKTDPTASNVQERFFAVKDNHRSGTAGISELEDITSGAYADSPSKRGWYIRLAGQGEKVLAEPTVFGGAVYFTSYTPPLDSDPCSQGGRAKLYGISLTTGAGILAQADAQGQPVGTPSRSMDIGTGIPSAPILSMKPPRSYTPGPLSSPADMYVTVSGGGGTDKSTRRVNFNPPVLANRTNLLYWKDRRLE